MPPAAPDSPAILLRRALHRHYSRLARTLEAVRGDLAEAERAPHLRRLGEALLTYGHLVQARSAQARVPDPADHAAHLEIELDPALSPQANAARYFKLAAKAERGLEQIPARMRSVENEMARVAEAIAKIDARLAEASGEEPPALPDPLVRKALDLLPPLLRRGLEPAPPGGASPKTVAAGEHRAPSSRLQPRRLRTSEGWDVLIGRNNDGNDYVTHRLARPEDYWFHVGGGVAGSHVVLRRGKGSDEPSKKTLEEVAAWAAFYSQARTAGKVPVIYTLKKYVRKPRKARPGLALCEREKSLMVRPVEPPRSALASEGDRAEDPPA
jgi:predicted ribosome quality control (RQC) complex YloA/Tae2 family protein